VLGRLFGAQKRAITVEDIWGPWYGDVGTTAAGIAVTQDSALQLMAVYGCVRLITDGISTLPIDAYRHVGDGREEIAKPDWLLQPTVDLTFAEWCTQIISSLLLRGNAYAVVSRIGNRIIEVVPLDPTQVMVRRVAGVKTYWVSGQPVHQEILHIKGLMLPGSDVGLSPLEYARQSIGLGLAAQEYGATFFNSDGNMPGVIEIPKQAQPDVKKKMAEGFGRKLSRGNRNRLPQPPPLCLRPHQHLLLLRRPRRQRPPDQERA